MKKKTILIVDDDRAVADSIRKLLEAEKSRVLVAVDGAEATSLFKTQPVDLVILDINLGEDNGWEVFLTMRQIKPSVPTIVITAECGQRDRAIAVGVEAFIEKPIDVSAFLELVRGLRGDACARNSGGRAQHSPDYFEYIARERDPFLLLLHERHSAPLSLSTEFTAALPDRGGAAKLTGSRAVKHHA